MYPGKTKPKKTHKERVLTGLEIYKVFTLVVVEVKAFFTKISSP